MEQSMNPLSKKRSLANGFTLVELLVVIGIISVLVAVVSAAAFKALKYSRKTACLSNLHQLGMAMNLYATDNNELYPIGFDSSSRTTWDQDIAGYLQTVSGSKIFQCPEASLPNNGGSTYSAHDFLTSENKAGRVRPTLIRVPHPELTILLADGCQDASIGGNAYSVFWNPWQMSYSSNVSLNDAIPVGPDVDDGSGAGWFRYRHDGQLNVVMVDGHAETIRKGSVLFSNVVPF